MEDDTTAAAEPESADEAGEEPSLTGLGQRWPMSWPVGQPEED